MVNNHHVIGSGPHRVIALPGWFGSADGWGPFVEYLDLTAFSYAFMDYRGYGGSKETTGDHTIAEIAGDTLDLADKLGWDRFSLLGHSMGGSAIQRVLLDAPDRVDNLVGVNPVPASGVPFDTDAWALFSGAADNPQNRRAIIDFTTGTRNTGVWLDKMVQHSLATSDRDAFAAYLTAWAKTDFHAEIESNARAARTPVKVIVGEHDPALGADAMRGTWLKWYQDADLEVLGNAGHYPMFETPVALATSVELFLRRDS